MIREYPKDLIEAEIKEDNFMPKKRNTKRDKSLKPVPFVITYHPKLSQRTKLFLNL